MRRIPRIAEHQCGAFTSAQAAAAGWTRSAQRHAVTTGQLLLVRRGVLAVPPVPSELPWEGAQARHRIAAAAGLLVRPDAVASHATAALLLGLPILDPEAVPCLTVPPGRASALSGIHLHRARVESPICVGTLALTRPALSVVDTAREHGEEAGLVIADAALAGSFVSDHDLQEALASRAGWPGVRIAQRVVAFADPRAESPLESISRLRIRQHGVPAPEPQVEIWIAGRCVGRCDFYWDEYGVIGEADGWGKYKNDWKRFRDQKRKDARYERAGAVVVRWDSDEAEDFAAVAARIRDGFRRAASRPRSERGWIARRRPR
jgi:hypothetical protein